MFLFASVSPPVIKSRTQKFITCTNQSSIYRSDLNHLTEQVPRFAKNEQEGTNPFKTIMLSRIWDQAQFLMSPPRTSIDKGIYTLETADRNE